MPARLISYPAHVLFRMCSKYLLIGSLRMALKLEIANIQWGVVHANNYCDVFFRMSFLSLPLIAIKHGQFDCK